MNRYINSFLIIFLVNLSVYSQSVSELKRRRLKATEDIENTSKLLSEKGNSKNMLLSNVSLLQAQIELRQKLISNVEIEVTRLDSLLSENEHKLDLLNRELGFSKKSYQDLIVHAFIHRSKFDELMFILGSENVSMAYTRYKILKEFSSHIKSQGEHLVVLSAEQLKLTNLIRDNLNQKQEVLETLARSTSALSQEKVKKQSLIKDLEKEESWLKKELSKKERMALALDNQIKAVIDAELKRQAKDKKHTIIPSDFANNKGHLIWPVDGGTVISFFGEHEHPILKSLKVNNSGIDIEVSKGAPVKSVFKGVVSKVFAVPGYNMGVIIRHGNYLTVYANLVKVSVSPGESVHAGSTIGILFTDSDMSRSTLHFEIRYETEKIDPISWLKD